MCKLLILICFCLRKDVIPAQAGIFLNVVDINCHGDMAGCAGMTEKRQGMTEIVK